MARSTIGELIVFFKANTTKFYQDTTRASNHFHRSVTRMTNVARNFAAGMVAYFSFRTAFRGLQHLTSLIGGFEKSMSAIKAVTDSTDEQMAKLTATARNLGATTEYTASEIADGMSVLGRAGLSTEQIIGTIPGVLAMATAGMLDMASSAYIVTTTLNLFKLKGSDATRVADVLSKGANSANAEVADLGVAMKFAGKPMADLGKSVEETVAALLAMHQAGLKGEMAGTGLRAVIAEILTATGELKRRLGDTNLATNSLADVMDRLSESGVNVVNVYSLFERKAAGAALTLITGADAIRNYEDRLNRAAGSAEKMRKTMQDNIPGAADQMRSALEELGHQLGDGGVRGEARKFYDEMTKLFREIIDSGRAAEFGQALAGAFSAITTAIKETTNFVVEFGIRWQRVAKQIQFTRMASEEILGPKENQDFWTWFGVRTSDQEKKITERADQMYQGWLAEQQRMRESITRPLIPTPVGENISFPIAGMENTEEVDDALKKLQDRAFSLAESFKHPVDVYRDFIAELNLLSEVVDENGKAFIDEEIYIRAADDALLQMQDDMRDLRLESGTWSDGIKQAMLDIQKSAQETAKNFYYAFSDAFNRLGDQMAEFFTTGKLGLKELEQDILRTFNRMIVQQLIIGPMAGLLGGLFPFSPAMRAAGGPVVSGTPYLVGEQGPELFSPNQNGRIYNTNDTQKMIQAKINGGNGVTVNQSMTIQSPDANGFRHSEDQILSRMNAMQRRVFRRFGYW